MTAFKRYTVYALFMVMTLALSLSTVMAQEEAAEPETIGSAGLIIIILATGALVILILGAFMNAQAQDQADASE